MASQLQMEGAPDHKIVLVNAQRLDFDQHRTASLDSGEDHRAGNIVSSVGKKQFRRVRHFSQAGLDHLEDADLVGGAKPVLHAAQDAKMV